MQASQTSVAAQNHKNKSVNFESYLQLNARIDAWTEVHQLDSSLSSCTFVMRSSVQIGGGLGVTVTPSFSRDLMQVSFCRKLKLRGYCVISVENEGFTA